MSKQIDLGEVECFYTHGSRNSDGQLFDASLESDDFTFGVNMDWYCTDESRLVPFAKGQRYRVILEQIDNV